MEGTGGAVDRKSPASNRALRASVMPPYSQLSGLKTGRFLMDLIKLRAGFRNFKANVRIIAIMSLQLSYQPHLLQFRFEAGTSRGVLTEKLTWILRITHSRRTVRGLGECGPLKGLSRDDLPGFAEVLDRICRDFNARHLDTIEADDVGRVVEEAVPVRYPSVRFGLETALLDYVNGGSRIIFRNDFSGGKRAIPMNGLVWMGTPEFMREQLEAKLLDGYTTIKIKVGAIGFGEECRLLASVRERFTKDEIGLRLDANGAFPLDQALPRLETLAQFDIHSIEQPVKPGCGADMARIIAESPIDVALDEELIGIWTRDEKRRLLDLLRPRYLILKPTLLGGFGQCREWIALAEEAGIGWWLTSALESNIGLNAIAQFAGEFESPLPQGLGTGQLYHNNIPSGLKAEAGHIRYVPDQPV